ncbi:hypothetical protein LGQ02_09235 [Bacillus shivajii]|uniref:hypothetical protein n=1 Tax=Bacillus shivajii TaxID=1983719 RepID=UPI001CFAFC09|nr:hypothetical protein [Bacillus shivajii]UCZ54905.1 hypothetical protein LGQ02_09235 [Bacillus shivajii]
MDDNKRVPTIIKVFALLKIIFVIGYFSFLLYVGIAWGFGERITLVFISDSAYILFIITAIGFLLKKKWSWWMSMIVFIKLFIAKFLSMIAEIVNIMTGMVAEPLRFELFIGDFLILILFIAIITFLSLPMFRNTFDIQTSASRIIFFSGLGAIILYFIYFIVMLLMISWLL